MGTSETLFDGDQFLNEDSQASLKMMIRPLPSEDQKIQTDIEVFRKVDQKIDGIAMYATLRLAHMAVAVIKFFR